MDEDYYNLPITSYDQEETNEVVDTSPVIPSATPEVSQPQEPVDYYSLPITSYDREGVRSEPAGSTFDSVLSDPKKVEAVRNYMLHRKGAHINQKSDEEILNDYLTHMRYVNTNEVSTLGEWRYVQQGDEETKRRAGEAYAVYDEMGNLWDSGVSRVGALKDYGLAVLLSPSTYLGGFVGKSVASAGSAGAKAALQTAMKEAYKAGGKEAAKAVLKSASRTQALKSVGIATGVDTGISTLADAMYQETMLETGAQDKWNWLQTGVSATGGLVGGAVAAIPELTRGVSGLSNVSGKIKRAKDEKVAQATSQITPKIKEAVVKLNQDIKSWQDATASGSAINPTKEGMMDAVGWFFDVEDPNSLARIILDTGVDINVGDDTTRFTEQLLNYARGIDQKSLDEYNEALAPTGYKFGEILDIIAESERTSGVILNKAQRAKRYATKLSELARAKKMADEGVLRGATEVPKLPDDYESPEVARYVASVWRRALVSHPATTAVNVVGWGQTSAVRTLAEMLHGGYLGTTGVAKALAKGDMTSLRRSAALIKHQSFKLRTLLDPYATTEAWETIYKTYPEHLQKQISRSIFGGIDAKSPMDVHHIPENKLTKTVEGYVDAASKISLVDFQDSITKAYSGLWELDKLSRLQYNRGLDDIIASGDYNLITEEMAMRSVNALLKDTLSQNLTKASGKDFGHEKALKALADSVERVSNAPYLGFIFPFGRFLNNNIAFMLEHSPLGLANAAFRIYRDEPFDIQEKIARGTVGTLALATIMSTTMQEQEQGMQWYEKEGPEGSIINTQNIAPGAMYLLVGRILANAVDENGVVSPELLMSVGDQLGTNQWMRELTGNTPLNDLLKYITTVKEAKDATVLSEALTKALAYVADLGSGFTRPLDPINRGVGMMAGNDMAIDRRQAQGGDKVLQNFSRYVGNLFAPILGEPTNTSDGEVVDVLGVPYRSATRPEGDIHDPNPLGSMMGIRQQPPKNHIDKLMGMVNLPPFIFDSRTSNPAFDRILNERIAPLLNDRAKTLLENPTFKGARQDIKLNMVRELFSETKDDIIDYMEDGGYGFDARLQNERRKWNSLPNTYRDDARLNFNITTPDRELSMEQLEMMKRYIEGRQDFQKRFNEEL